MDKPLQRIDHFMWDAEAPNSLVTIAGMMVFKKLLNKQKLTEVIRQRLLPFERFQKKVIIKDGNPTWHVDEYFQLESHIHHIALPGKGGYKELQECISDLMSQPFNYGKPLWDLHLIDNYKNGSVLFWRLHHAIGDGMALINVVISLTGTSAADSLSVTGGTDIAGPKKAKSEAEHLLDVGLDAYENAKELLSHPAMLRDSLHSSWLAAMELGELFLGKTVTANLYKGELGIAKKAAWTVPLSLETIKQIAKHNGVKVNDVLMALVAGAVRKHLQLHEQKINVGLKVVVPVNIRKNQANIDLHNEFSWMSLDLPIHISSFQQRVAFIGQKTAALKPSVEPILLNELIHIVADYTPVKAKQMILGIAGKHIGGAITNIPGPSRPIYMAGTKVEDLMCFIPHTSALGIGISLMSYNGKVHMGIVTDQRLVNDPDVIVKAFTHELNKEGKLIQAI